MLGTLGQILAIGDLPHAAGWAAFAVALLVALVLTAEYYLFGRAEMDIPIAVRHGAGLLIIFAGVWAWALVVQWVFLALMFTLTVGIGSAFMALWHLLDYREDQAKRLQELEAASREAGTWIETVPSLPRDEQGGIHVIPTMRGQRQRDVPQAVNHSSDPSHARRSAREIWIGPQEMLVVEDDRIAVREVHADVGDGQSRPPPNPQAG